MVKRKNNVKCKAEDMYQVNFFRTCLQYAKTLKGDIYILSAKYGVLDRTTEIYPYDKTLNKMTQDEILEWSKMVKEQLKERNIKDTNVIFFYVEKIIISLYWMYFRITLFH